MAPSSSVAPYNGEAPWLLPLATPQLKNPIMDAAVHRRLLLETMQYRRSRSGCYAAGVPPVRNNSNNSLLVFLSGSNHMWLSSQWCVVAWCRQLAASVASSQRWLSSSLLCGAFIAEGTFACVALGEADRQALLSNSQHRSQVREHSQSGTPRGQLHSPMGGALQSKSGSHEGRCSAEALPLGMLHSKGLSISRREAGTGRHLHLWMRQFGSILH